MASRSSCELKGLMDVGDKLMRVCCRARSEVDADTVIPGLP